MDFVVLIKSLIIGGLVGTAVGAGAARMFHAPTTQGMGAFRTLGEMNACEGDPAAHFTFGLGFFFNAWASVVAFGAFTQDIDHRIIPNWGAAVLLTRNRNVAQTMHDPKQMAIICGIIGAILIAFLNTSATAVPEELRTTAVKVLMPAASLLVDIAMPVIFWLAAIGAGQRAGFWGTLFGGLAHMIMGNAVPGVVLGILIGKGVDEGGWNHVTRVMMGAVISLFLLSGFFRGFDIKILKEFNIEPPAALVEIHDKMSGKTVDKPKEAAAEEAKADDAKTDTAAAGAASEAAPAGDNTEQQAADQTNTPSDTAQESAQEPAEAQNENAETSESEGNAQ